MKSILATIAAALCLTSGATARALEKRSSSSWAGSNLYYLHGLSDSDQDYYLDTLSSYGAKVVRIWVAGTYSGAVKGSCVADNIPELEPNSIGTYDDTVLGALDSVLSKMAAKGMKAIISPHDGNLFGTNPGNGCDVYCHAYGSGQSGSDNFYQSTDAKAHYDARLAHILNYRSPSSGLSWSQWSEAILAFDIQNEPMQFSSDLYQNNDPSDWICGRAGNMQPIINDSGVLIATGGIGGDQSHGANLMSKALYCSAIQLMSIHAYVGTANFWGTLANWESQTAAQGKKLYVEEWGVSTDYQDDFNAQAPAINAQGIPWVYWQMVPGPDGTQNDAGDCFTGCCNGGYDGFEIGLNSTKGNLQQYIQQADNTGAKQDWTGSIY